MEANIDRKHCLVTGANRGLGLELASQLLARQRHVVATCRHPGKATALNRLAAEHPGRLHVLPLDVADARSRDALLRELPLVTDEAPLHLLVNNAGVLRGGERFAEWPAAAQIQPWPHDPREAVELISRYLRYRGNLRALGRGEAEPVAVLIRGADQTAPAARRRSGRQDA